MADFKISSEQEKWIEGELDDTAGYVVKMTTLKWLIEKFVNEERKKLLPTRPLTATYTYAELEVSEAVYDEVRKKLEDAGYEHTFMDNDCIDMHGIGLKREGE